MIRAKIVLFLLLSAVAGSLLARPAQLIRDTNLHKEPYRDAQVVEKLEAKSKLEVIKRRGGWYRVTSQSGVEGWVRMTTLRFIVAEGEKRRESASGLDEAASMLTTGRSGSSGVTTATGIRGLSSEELTDSSPDRGQLESLDKNAVSKRDAKGFAKKEGLKAQDLDYLSDEDMEELPDPEPESGSNSNDFFDSLGNE
ncbi:hypothetical protein BOW53_00260 [Solemya pervernicosa gill symbiont]|uniref:SH3b domain-containing protein n=2 Tax=Gammaproteobacteria incertae sedis TaxID=118884 RepID=A0A1T2LB27_9GAMM|nr:SH3 domain-containing protein [Candidatus Reidiella endopervernicosa]OOZ42313.1 hypothetical protein BOW53_00260 [Solemya pervernicosa gill symbiont]QKQ25709.1 SH3 domain-containing protein [Candidatus Reidiella endopervernicosa]